VTVQLIACFNADVPALAKPVDIAMKMDRSKFVEGLRKSDRPDSFMDEEDLESLIAGGVYAASGDRPWRCRGCGGLSTAFKLGIRRFEENKKDIINASPHAATVTTSIVIPLCQKRECADKCEAICSAYQKQNMYIDACNPKGFRDYDFEPGKKPGVQYSMHIDADLGQGQAKIEKTLLYDVGFAINSWDSLPKDRQEELKSKIEDKSTKLVVAKKMGGPNREYKCRGCNEAAVWPVCAGTKSALLIPDESIFVTQPFAIPVCRSGMRKDTPCGVLAMQRAEQYKRDHLLGKEAVDKGLRLCYNCDKKEEGSGISFKYCSVCKVIWYCSPDCQRAHWKNGHKQACRPWDFSSNQN